jgi:photosystem II stability/assembly factor-like uncharacterized protein
VKRCLALFALGLAWTHPAMSAQWQPIGPEGGTVVSLAVDSTTPSTIYAAADGAGVFKSTDGAATWVYASTGLAPRRARVIVIDPRNPATLYAGVSDGGVMKSTDGALTWQPTGLWGNATVRALAVDPSSPSTLYASLDSSGIEEEGVFRSTDGGAAWAQLHPEDRSRITALSVDPASGTVYAAVQNRGLFRSEDRGATWLRASAPEPLDVRDLAVHPAGGIVYAASGRDVLRSADGGVTWRRTALLPAHIQALRVHPRLPRVLFAALSPGGVYRSADQGRTWQRYSPQRLDPSALALAVDPGNLQLLYVGTERSGMLHRSEAGAWSVRNRGLRAVEADAVEIDPKRPRTLYLASRSGLFQTTDGGRSWRRRLEAATERPQLEIDPVRPATVYFLDGSLWRTRDRGASFVDVTAGSFVQLDAIAVAARNSPVLYGGGRGELSRSLDGGQTWQPIELSNPASCIWYETLVVPPGSPDEVFAAGIPGCFANQGGGIARSVDVGQTWTTPGLDHPLLPRTVTALAVDPEDPATLYAGGETRPLGGPSRTGTFTSTDAGETWSQLGSFGGTFSRPATAILPLPGERLVVGTSDRLPGLEGEGVFTSGDGGLTWTPVNEGLWSLDIRELEAAPNDPSVLYAATAGGLFRRTGT